MSTSIIIQLFTNVGGIALVTVPTIWLTAWKTHDSESAAKKLESMDKSNRLFKIIGLTMILFMSLVAAILACFGQMNNVSRVGNVVEWVCGNQS